MTVSSYFAKDYADAREKFRSAAREAGAEVVHVAPDESAGPEWESWFYVFTV